MLIQIENILYNSSNKNRKKKKKKKYIYNIVQVRPTVCNKYKSNRKYNMPAASSSSPGLSRSALSPSISPGRLPSDSSVEPLGGDSPPGKSLSPFDAMVADMSPHYASSGSPRSPAARKQWAAEGGRTREKIKVVRSYGKV